MNGSLLLDLIYRKFPEIPIHDVYLEHRGQLNVKNSIVVLDDEMFASQIKFRHRFLHCRNCLFIAKRAITWRSVLDDSNQIISFPYFPIIDDIISLNQLKQKTIKECSKFNKEYNFICLNRQARVNRKFVIEYLHKRNLLEKGHVTAQFDVAAEIRELLAVSSLSHYTMDITGFERHNHIIDSIPCSSTVNNYLYILENLSGHTMISCETELLYPTEKTFLFAFCKKMPITISSRNTAKILTSEGFDYFDDILDHSYDSETNCTDKIIKSIDDNIEVLISDMSEKQKEIEYRTNKNFTYLTTTWFEQKLDQLFSAIDNWKKLL